MYTVLNSYRTGTQCSGNRNRFECHYRVTVKKRESVRIRFSGFAGSR
jgi:hypothetical protein